MRESQSPYGFSTTRWTLVRRAAENRDDLAVLLEVYRAPILAYFRRKAANVHQAEDLTQQFICDKVLEGSLLQKSDPSYGKFRTFLLSALDHFRIDEYRQLHGRDGSRSAEISYADVERVKSTRHQDADPVHAFNRQWAATVMGLVVERLEQECRALGLERHWSAYHARVLLPRLNGSCPPTVTGLARELGATPSQVSHMIELVKRHSGRVLRDVVAETIDAGEDVEEEIRGLAEYLNG